MRRWEKVRSLAAAILAATGSWRRAPATARWREGGRGPPAAGAEFPPEPPERGDAGALFSLVLLSSMLSAAHFGTSLLCHYKHNLNSRFLVYRTSNSN